MDERTSEQGKNQHSRAESIPPSHRADKLFSPALNVNFKTEWMVPGSGDGAFQQRINSQYLEEV